MSQKQLSRREFLRLGSMAAGSFALAACGSPAAQTPGRANHPRPGSGSRADHNNSSGAVAGRCHFVLGVLEQLRRNSPLWEPALLEKLKPNTIKVSTGVNADEVFLPAVLDARSGEIVDKAATGIIDSAGVLLAAVREGIASAGLVLTVDVLIHKKRPETSFTP